MINPKTIIRKSFVGKTFVPGDTFLLKCYPNEKLLLAPFIYKDFNSNTFMSCTGDFIWKSNVKQIQCNSLKSKFIWLFQ